MDSLRNILVRKGFTDCKPTFKIKALYITRGLSIIIFFINFFVTMN